MFRANLSVESLPSSRSALSATMAMLLCLPAAAQAEGLDYAELEKLFGEPVTASVSGKPQRASETAGAVVIITKADIARSPARDLVGVIRAYAGIDVARWTGGQSDVSIRGGIQPFNARLLVLVNGQQVYLDHYGMTNWSGIGVQLEEIQQIEVVKGPNSALFGFNAVSGVINIITIDPLQTQQLTATVEGGTHDYMRASISAAVKLHERVGLRLSGGYGKNHELDDLRQFITRTMPGEPVPDPKQIEGAGELYAKLGERTEAVLSASHSYTRRTDLIFVGLTSRSDIKFTSFGGKLTHDTGWGLLSGRIYQNKVDFEAPIPVLPVPLDIHNKVLVASADALVRVDSANTLRTGIEYRDNRLDTSPGLPGATRYNVYAANAMWESELSDALTFTLAGRVDHLKLRQEGEVDQPSFFTKQDYDRSFTELSFNTALRLKLDESTSIRAAAARGVQAPSLFSLGSRVALPIPGLPFPVVVAGDPSNDPSIIWSAEVGVNRILEKIDGKFELNAFYNHTRDVIGAPAVAAPPVAAPPAYPFVLTLFDNVGSFEAYGVEASLTGRIGNHVSWLAYYSWTHAQQDIEGETPQSFRWPVLLNRTTPEHKINAQISYERDAWLGTIAARYRSATKQFVAFGGPLELVTIDGAVAIDAKIGWKASDHLTFELAGENLTNAAGADHSPFAAERRLRAIARVSF